MTKTQILVAGILAGVLAIVSAIAIYFGVSLGGDTPTTPPTPEPNDDVISLYLGETYIEEITAQGCLPVQADIPQLRVQTTKVAKYNTGSQVSYTGAEPGLYDDIVRVGEQACDEPALLEVTGLAPGEVELDHNGKKYLFEVLSEKLPPIMPFYSELAPGKIVTSYGYTNSTNISITQPIINQFIRALREHHVEPIKHSYSRGVPTNLDYFQEFGASFRQLVLTDNIAPPMLVRHDPYWFPSIEDLQFIELKMQDGTLPEGSWIYIWDEGQLDQSKVTEAIKRAELVKEYAPSVKVMVTWEPIEAARDVIDWFFPVLNWYGRSVPREDYPSTFGLYISCMSSGSCSGTSNHTELPDLGSIEKPSVYSRVFPIMVQHYGAEMGLYYSATEALNTSLDVGGQFIFGNHGDGNLFYPGPNGLPWPSLRLKWLKRGLEDAAIAKEKGLDLSPLIRSNTDWEKDMTKYEALIH